MNKKSIRKTINEAQELILQCEDIIKDDEFQSDTDAQKNEIINMYKEAVAIKARMELMLSTL